MLVAGFLPNERLGGPFLELGEFVRGLFQFRDCLSALALCSQRHRDLVTRTGGAVRCVSVPETPFRITEFFQSLLQGCAIPFCKQRIPGLVGEACFHAIGIAFFRRTRTFEVQADSAWGIGLSSPSDFEKI